jgi:phage tail sheath protein FI
MPVTPTYPGVYVEEIPSGVRTITGVATSIAAFLDFFIAGPMNQAVQVLSYADFEREFGGLHRLSEASYGIQQFFLNGGSEAWVVRVAGGSPAKASVVIGSGTAAESAALTVRAISEGVWGNRLRARVDPLPDGGFNLAISEYATVGGRPTLVRQEAFRGLSMDRTRTSFVETVVNDPNTGSKMARVTAAGNTAPPANGTLSGPHASDPILSLSPMVSVTIGAAPHLAGTAALTLDPTAADGKRPVPLADVREPLERAIRCARHRYPEFAAAEVGVDGAEHRLLILPGGDGWSHRLSFDNVPDAFAAAGALRLTGEAQYRGATLSGRLDDTVTLPTGATLSVSVGAGAARLVPLPLSGVVQRDKIREELEKALNDSGPTEPAFHDARVLVHNDRLLVLVGGPGGSPPLHFASVGEDQTASLLKLTGDDVEYLTAALSGRHESSTAPGTHTEEGPKLPATSLLEITSSDGQNKSVEASLKLPVGVTLPGPVPLLRIAPALQAALQTAKPENPALAAATVEVVGNQLLAHSGPGRPHDRIFFTTVAGNPTARLLGLTDEERKDVPGLLSGPHTSTLTLAAPLTVSVTIGGTGATARTATLQFTGGLTDVTLAQAREALEKALRAAAGSDTNDLYRAARVFVAQNRLLVLPGGEDPATKIVFADTGSTSGVASALKLTDATATLFTVPRSGSLSAEPLLIPAAPAIDVTMGGKSGTATLSFASGPPLPSSRPLAEIATALEAALRAAGPTDPHFARAQVLVDGEYLLVVPGGSPPFGAVSFCGAEESLAARELLLTVPAGAIPNSQEYTLGDGPVGNTGQRGGERGDDGGLPHGNDLIGSPSAKTGLYALRDVDLFNLLCIPRAAMVGNDPDDLSADEAKSVIVNAETLCEERRAFFLVDTPKGIDEPQEVKNWLTTIARHRNAALYYPRVRVPDPLNEFRLRSFGASGTAAGLFARTDSSRGVWKAPAGTETTLRNVSELEDRLTDPENGTLNPLAINCLRTFPVYGTVCWGARTLEGSDQQASEWKYVPVRRLALFLEESLYRGTKWVVFEPNDEPLWAQIRLNVGAFMHNLFRQGAFQGRSPREAYFVKCDRETTTQNDINLGIVNILVGFAPLKPAEFVILKIQQLPGQVEV